MRLSACTESSSNCWHALSVARSWDTCLTKQGVACQHTPTHRVVAQHGPAWLAAGLLATSQSLRQLWVQVAELPDISGAHFMPVTQKGQAMLLSAIKDGTIPL